jgi:TetR/AcrR family transcriptional regulator, tetracycline repressor protein
MVDGVPRRAQPQELAPAAAATQRGRAAWGTISREQVVQAAMRFVEAGDFEKMTIRSIARELGVAPMSLYRHVRNKGDLLGEVVDRLQERSWRPGVTESDWRAWVAEAADKLRHFLVTQPAALHVYLRHPVVSPAAMARMKAMTDVLGQSGADVEAVRRAYAAIHTYTVGFAALEASWGDRLPIDDNRGDGNDDLAEQLAAYTTPSQFAVGLRYLLDGIERDAETGSTPPGGSAEITDADRRE